MNYDRERCTALYDFLSIAAALIEYMHRAARITHVHLNDRGAVPPTAKSNIPDTCIRRRRPRPRPRHQVMLIAGPDAGACISAFWIARGQVQYVARNKMPHFQAL